MRPEITPIPSPDPAPMPWALLGTNPERTLQRLPVGLATQLGPGGPSLYWHLCAPAVLGFSVSCLWGPTLSQVRRKS